MNIELNILARMLISYWKLDYWISFIKILILGLASIMFKLSQASRFFFRNISNFTKIIKGICKIQNFAITLSCTYSCQITGWSGKINSWYIYDYNKYIFNLWNMNEVLSFGWFWRTLSFLFCYYCKIIRFTIQLSRPSPEQIDK